MSTLAAQPAIDAVHTPPTKLLKKILVLGATSGIAEATCRIWASQGAQLFLVARNPASHSRWISPSKRA